MLTDLYSWGLKEKWLNCIIIYPADLDKRLDLYFYVLPFWCVQHTWVNGSGWVLQRKLFIITNGFSLRWVFVFWLQSYLYFLGGFNERPNYISSCILFLFLSFSGFKFTDFTVHGISFCRIKTSPLSSERHLIGSFRNRLIVSTAESAGLDILTSVLEDKGLLSYPFPLIYTSFVLMCLYTLK